MAGRASDLIFEVTHDELDGYYTAAALGFGITTRDALLKNCAPMSAKLSTSISIHLWRCRRPYASILFEKKS